MIRAKPQTSVWAVELLELLEAAAVDEAGDDLAHVEGLAQVRRDDAVELLGVVVRAPPAAAASSSNRRGGSRVSTMFRAIGQGVLVVGGVVVGDARDAAVDVGPAEVLVA